MSTINGFGSAINSLSLNFETFKHTPQDKAIEPLAITIEPLDLGITLDKHSPRAIKVSSTDAEIQIFKKFGFNVKNESELAALKQRLGGRDPFAFVESDKNGYTARLENGKYVIRTGIEARLRKELEEIAVAAQNELPISDNAEPRENPNNVAAEKRGIAEAARQRTELEKKLPPRIPGHVPGLPPSEARNPIETFQRAERIAEEFGQMVQAELAKPEALDAFLDEVQGALDIMGILDPTPVTDGASAVISLAREHYGYAALSAIAAVLPYGGDALKLAKLPKLIKSAERAVEFAAAAPRITEKTLDKLQALQKVLAEVPLADVPKATREALEGLTTKVDAAIDASKAAPKAITEVAELAQQIKAAKASIRRTQPSLAPDTARKPTGIAEIVPTKGDPANAIAIKRQNDSAELLAQNGYSVEYNPRITANDIKREPSLQGVKDPDFRIENEIFDCLATTSDRALNIRDKIAAKTNQGQTTRLILNLDGSKVLLDELKQVLTDTPVKDLKEVIVIKDGKITHFFPFK